MKRLLLILVPVLFLACGKQQKPVDEQTLPFAFDENLLHIDSLLQHDADSALMTLLTAQHQTNFDKNYQSLLISEALYKTDNPQLNRHKNETFPETSLHEAIDYFDSLYANYPKNDDLVVLSARSHYMNGIGFYENDSVVDACKEYLKTLEIMEDHFDEKELVGYKAKFMSLTYGRLYELFSDQFMMEPAIYYAKKWFDYCIIEPTSKYGASNALYRIGQNYDMLRQPDSALYYYNKAFESLPDSNNIIYRDLVANTSLLSYSFGKNTDSILFNLRQIIKQADNEDEVVTRYIPVGYIYYKEKIYDSALYYFEKVFLNKKDFLSRCYPAECLRSIYLYLGDTIKSHEYSAYLADNTPQQYENSVNVSRLTSLFQDSLYNRKNNVTHNEIIIIVCVLLVLVATIIVFVKSKADKSIYKDRDGARERREALIREPVCKDIISKVVHLNLSAREDYFAYDLALSDDVITSLHSVVLKHCEKFDTVLLSKCPNLNNNDFLLCYLLLLGLNEKQIAVLRNRTYSAIKKQIAKIEKQLSININLSDFIISMI